MRSRPTPTQIYIFIEELKQAAITFRYDSDVNYTHSNMQVGPLFLNIGIHVYDESTKWDYQKVGRIRVLYISVWDDIIYLHYDMEIYGCHDLILKWYDIETNAIWNNIISVWNNVISVQYETISF